MMTLTTYTDEHAPRKERYRVLESKDGAPGSRWLTVASFPTVREADAFARGYWKGSRKSQERLECSR